MYRYYHIWYEVVCTGITIYGMSTLWYVQVSLQYTPIIHGMLRYHIWYEYRHATTGLYGNYLCHSDGAGVQFSFSVIRFVPSLPDTIVLPQREEQLTHRQTDTHTYTERQIENTHIHTDRQTHTDIL